MRNTLAATAIVAAAAGPAQAQEPMAAATADRPYVCAEGNAVRSAATCGEVAAIRLGDALIGSATLTQDATHDDRPAQRLGELRVPSQAYASLSDAEMRLLDTFGTEQRILSHDQQGSFRGYVTIAFADPETRFELGPQASAVRDRIDWQEIGNGVYRFHPGAVIETLGRDGQACLDGYVTTDEEPGYGIGTVLRLGEPEATRERVGKQTVERRTPPIECEAPATRVPPQREAPPVYVAPPPIVRAPDAGFVLLGLAPIYKNDVHHSIRTEEQVCFGAEGIGGEAELVVNRPRLAIHANGLYVPAEGECAVPENAPDREREEFDVSFLEVRGAALYGSGLAFGGTAELFDMSAENEDGTELRLAYVAPTIGFRSADFMAGIGPMALSGENHLHDWTGFGATAFVDAIGEELRGSLRGHLYKADELTGANGVAEAAFTPLDLGPVSIGPLAGLRYDALCLDGEHWQHNWQYRLGGQVAF